MPAYVMTRVVLSSQEAGAYRGANFTGPRVCVFARRAVTGAAAGQAV